MTLENEKRFLLLLGSYAKGANVTKAEVLDTIDDRGWAVFTDKDLAVKHNRNELVWRNDFAFVRKHLVEEGYYQSGIRNDWPITESGKAELRRLCGEVLSEAGFSYVSPAAKEEAQKVLLAL